MLYTDLLILDGGFIDKLCFCVMFSFLSFCCVVEGENENQLHFELLREVGTIVYEIRFMWLLVFYLIETYRNVACKR